ncbi:redox-regulated ATPase YchF [Candidatus Daviesbacteria bacterium]|nr:redox-regulated ATPase YchF [Candidatus Daviesbacteria bacterium]
MKVGIVGLPNVGKSTLFNALLKKRVALSANYPFATVEPNVGVVAVPDERLVKLAWLVAKEENMIPQEILKQVQDDTPGVEVQKYLPPLVPAVVEFVDIAGLVKGAATGAGLGNQFLSHIREVDAIVHVLRDFGDIDVVREGSVSPDEDKLTVETELGLADLQVLEKLVLDKTLEKEQLDILNRIKEELDSGSIPGKYQVGERLEKWFNTLPLLSIKPVLFVYNVGEQEYDQKVLDRERNETALIISAKLEEELADLDEAERLDYLKEMGIEETGLERLIKKVYTLLGLISFLTAGKKEVRAWTIKNGTKAPQAAGVIHTDFEKKFIRAEVVAYEKLIEADSHVAAKSKGLIRTEGKDYIMRDGDVVEFLVGN